jgi:sugar phosphate isomerase/epimerase
MDSSSSPVRALGTMVAYGYPNLPFEQDLQVATQIGATMVEILPSWRDQPDPREARNMTRDAGLRIHSAHGCWGGQTIRALRVDLSDRDRTRWDASVDDLRWCIDWLIAAGGHCLVVHPGGMSRESETSARRDALARGLLALADHARGSNICLCVENMPPGVSPGSRMADVARLVSKLNRPELALAIDTGHAHLSGDLTTETLAARGLLRTTHVHDNLGVQDSHLVPGQGSIDWSSWAAALDQVGYNGPIMLECIRELRREPQLISESLRQILGGLTNTI